MVHLILAYQTLALLAGIVATILFFICRNKKPYLAPFQLFYLCFTTMSLLDVLAIYAVSNIRDGLLLFSVIVGVFGTIIGNALLYFVIKTYHVLFALDRPKTEWLIIICLSFATILMFSPLGMQYLPETNSIQMKWGSHFHDAVYFIIFSYIMAISFLRVWKVENKSDRHFAILLFVFALQHYIGLPASMYEEFQDSVHPIVDDIDLDYFDAGTLLYFIFSLFLINLLFRSIVQNTHSENALTEQNLLSYGFSEREKELLPLILSGKSNQQIADILHISLSTVKTHLNKIFKKATVKSRFELAQKLKT